MSHRRRRPDGKLGSTKGFTLVELLVTIVIAGILVAGMAGMFKSARVAYVIGDQVKSMEENVRTGMDFIARAVKQTTVNATVAMWAMDNTATGVLYSGGLDLDAFRALMSVKSGTDILEMVTSLCPEPLIISFNEKSASMPNLPLSQIGPCLPCDISTLGSAKAVDEECLQGLNATIRDVNIGNKNYTCYGEVTGGSAPSKTIALNYNRGTGTSNAPGQCANPDQGTNSWLARIDFGYHYVFFVYDDPNEPDNPKLMRYRLNGVYPGEALGNYIIDMQILVGLDTDTDGLLNVDFWNNGCWSDAECQQIRSVKFSVLGRSPGEDTTTGYAGPAPQQENSSIAELATSTRHRNRVMTRTVRLRNFD